MHCTEPKLDPKIYLQTGKPGGNLQKLFFVRRVRFLSLRKSKISKFTRKFASRQL